MLYQVLIVASGLGIGAALFSGLLGRRKTPESKKGSSSRNRQAEELGLEKTIEPLPREILAGLPIVDLHAQFQGQNCLAGEACGATVQVFEFHAEDPSVVQTVVMLSSGRLSLPKFYARPKSRTDRWLAAEKDQILVDSAFCQSWVVDGDDEEAIHALFTPDVIELLSELEFSIEGAGERLLLYRKDHISENVEDYLKVAFQLHTLLCVASESAEWQTVPMQDAD